MGKLRTIFFSILPHQHTDSYKHGFSIWYFGFSNILCFPFMPNWEAPYELGTDDFAPPGYATSKNCILLVLLVIYNPRRVSWHLSAFLFTFVVLHNTHGLRFKMLSDFVKGVCVSVSHSICCFCVILKRKGENITLTLLFKKKKKGSLLLHFKWNKAGCCRLCIIDMFDAKKWR